MSDTFINVRELIPILLKYKEDNPSKKIAFCFSGGGARGAYFGGVIEAIKQEINKHPQQALLPIEDRWTPDIICGTSAGAIAGFSYWMECLLPSSQTPYACRQTNIWKDVSDGNNGAQKLLDNYHVIEYMSKSSKTADDFLDALDKLNMDFTSIIENIDKQWADIKLIISNVGSFDLSRFQNNIQARINDIKGKADSAGNPPGKGSNLGDWKNYAGAIFDLIKGIHTIIPYIFQDLADMQIDQAKNLLQNVKDLNSDVQAGRKDIGIFLNHVRELFNKVQTLYNELKEVLFLTKQSIKNNSSLMNTSGLQNVLENYIFNSFPSGQFTLNSDKIEARDLDMAIVKKVNEKLSANKKVPDLFITGTNINAKRGVVFSLAPTEIYNNVANKNLWVIKLDDIETDFSSHKMMTNDFVFGGKRFDEEYTHSVEIKPTINTSDSNTAVNANINNLNLNINKGEMKATIHKTIKTALNPIATEHTLDLTAIKIENIVTQNKQTANSASSNSTVTNFTNIEMDFTKGKSLFVGAVLTSATIPIAFPPRQWTFFSQNKERYKHWMVDGGVVDTRPIDAAVKAGAEFIISFELTPLLSATRELRKEVEEYPKIMEIITKSMIDSTLIAGFYRYFEDLVTENVNSGNPSKYVIYRMAPMMYNTPEDVDYGNGPDWDEHTPGVYDFNGKYDKERYLKMGLFDWFMKGYIDAKGGDSIDMTDPVNNEYNNLPESFGAKKNAYQGRRSGFYNASLKAHPDTNPPW